MLTNDMKKNKTKSRQIRPELTERKYRRKLGIAFVLLLIANLLFFLTIWLLEKYDHIYFDQVLFQTKTSSAGVHHALLSSAFVRVGLYGIALTATEILLYWILSGRCVKIFRNHIVTYRCTKVCNFFVKHALPLALCGLILATSVFVAELDVIAYIEIVTTKSDFIEENYVSPDKASLTFPKQKRNLVYIFLESMENTFADTSIGSVTGANLIPELTELAEDNICFSNADGLGGAKSFTGTTWTAAAMVAQTSGVPVKVPITANSYGAHGDFMPGLVSLGDILEEQGYNQTLLVGSDAEFHGREAYFTQHGNYEIVDTKSLKATGRLAEDYNEWWGFEDQKLFAYAKEELTRLASEGEPFNLTMLTADTHFPDGYPCRLCDDTYDSQYANVLSCSSRQVYAFVKWVQQQPFYENTTVIISGDHLTMDSSFLENLDEDYIRTIYNCIINAPIEAVNKTNRKFGTFDMFPTTLAALGVEIGGDRLGLGTNLFSYRETLTETYGFDALNEELQKKSEFYNTTFLNMAN